MKKEFLGSLAAIVAAAGVSFGQLPAEPLPVAPVVPEARPSPGSYVNEDRNLFADADPNGTRLWFSAEYLMWWFKDSPVPVPLVTTGTPGVLGAPGTKVLLGGSEIDTEEHHGGRFTAGYWFGSDREFGVEGSYFFVASQSTTQSVQASGKTGSAFLSFPFFDVTTPGESTGAIALPGVFRGLAVLTIASRLEGGELNMTYNVPSGSGARVNLLGGFRTLNLRETMSFFTNSPFLTPVPADVYNTLDEFDMRNHFYGGQIGIRSEYGIGRLFFNMTTKVALGDMHETASVHGQLVTNEFTGFGATQTVPGGYLAQRTNIGHFSRDRFAVIPDVNVNVGAQITDRARVFVGYSFLYASEVIRPGDQIDRRINPTQSSTFGGAPPKTLVGPAAPVFPFNGSDFWAQGINFGLELRY